MDLRKLTPNTREQFFALLRYGLGTDSAERNTFATYMEWDMLYRLSREQTLTAIILDGVSVLPKDMRPERTLLMQWFADVLSIERQNTRHNSALASLIGACNDTGLHTVLLKGQGCCLYYPNPLHRQCGDIDLYVGSEQYQAAQSLVKCHGITIERHTVQDFHFTWHKIPVECHRMAARLYDTRLNKKLQDILQLELAHTCTRYVDGCSIEMPSPTCNAFFLFVHLYHHFMQVGIGMRQICDYTLALQKEQDCIDWEHLETYINNIKAKRAFTAFYHFAKERIGLRLDKEPYWMAAAYNMKDVHFIEDDILTVGNMGHSSSSMQHRSFGKGFLNNIYSYFQLGKRLCMMMRFGHEEVCAYICEKVWKKTPLPTGR